MAEWGLAVAEMKTGWADEGEAGEEGWSRLCYCRGVSEVTDAATATFLFIIVVNVALQYFVVFMTCG